MSKFRRENQTKLQRWQWRILLAFSFLYFFYYFGRENIDFAIPLLKKERGWTSAQLGMVSSGLFWAYALGQLLWGRLSDRFGGRLLCGIGGLLSMVLNWICSLATSVMALAVPWALNGLAQSMGWAPGNKLIANWWPRERRGYAIGIVSSFAGGAVIAVWFLSGLIGTHWGWQGLFQIPVVLLGIISIAYFFLVRDFPHQVGLPDYPDYEEQIRVKGNICKVKGIESYLNLLKSWKFDLACLTAGIANFARYFFTIWIPLYYTEVGKLSLDKIGTICLVLPMGMTIGPLVAGWVSDRLFQAKRYPVIAIFLFISAVLTFILGITPVTKLFWHGFLLFLIGFFIYGSQGPIYALSIDLAGKNQAGTAAGVMDSTSYIFGAFQGMIIGKILTLSKGNWLSCFTLVAASQLIGVGIIEKVKK